MTIQSGAPSASRNYWLLWVAIGLVGIAWFVYDGAVRYPSANREKAREHLNSLGVTEFSLGESPTQEDLASLRTAAVSTPAQLHDRLGQPTYRKDEGGGIAVEQFAGRYGILTARIERDHVIPESLSWQGWGKSKDDIQGQFYWAAAPALLLAYGLFRFYKAITLRIVLDESGLTYDGERIPFDAMRDLRDYSPKGWVDLYYAVDEDEKKLRLDNQRIDRFNDIVQTICDKKGFANPLKPAATA